MEKKQLLDQSDRAGFEVANLLAIAFIYEINNFTSLAQTATDAIPFVKTYPIQLPEEFL